MERRTHLSTGLAVLLAALVAFAVSAWPAQAAGAAAIAGSGTVQITPDNAEAGEQIGLIAADLSCAQTPAVYWGAEPLTASDVVALPVFNVSAPAEANNFTFTADADVPAGSTPGPYEVVVECSREVQAEVAAAVPTAVGSVSVVTLTSSAPMVQAGGSVSISGSGFTQCTTVDLYGNGALLATPSQSNGVFQQPIPVPLATPAGLFAVTAGCPGQPSYDLVQANVYAVTLTLSSGSGSPGAAIGVTGGGYQCAEVQLQLLQGETHAVAAVSLVFPGNGLFNATVNVPSSAVPGNDYQVDAGCYPAASGTAPIAVDPFTVTPAVSTSASSTQHSTSASATPSSPTSSSPSQSGTGSSVSASASLQSGTPAASSTGTASAAVPSSSATERGGGSITPIALVGSISAGGAVVLALLLVRALSVLQGRRGRGWVSKHLRVTAGRAEAWSASVEPRPGATSVSVGLQPHLDHFGDQQQYEEVPR
jgi:hypothetical protein